MNSYSKITSAIGTSHFRINWTFDLYTVASELELAGDEPNEETHLCSEQLL